MVDEGREQRLAEALRANLRRRKAQARAQDKSVPGEDRPNRAPGDTIEIRGQPEPRLDADACDRPIGGGRRD